MAEIDTAEGDGDAAAGVEEDEPGREEESREEGERERGATTIR